MSSKLDDDNAIKKLMGESFIGFLMIKFLSQQDHRTEIAARLLNSWADEVKRTLNEESKKRSIIESEALNIESDVIKIIFDTCNVETLIILEEYKTELLKYVCNGLCKMGS